MTEIGLLDLSTAPPGKCTPWPLLYTCDMVAGFHQMKNLELSIPVTKNQFTHVFGVQWKQSTFGDSYRVWTRAPINEIDVAVAMGGSNGLESRRRMGAICKEIQ